MITYKNVPFEFNWALWKETISALVSEHGEEFVSEYLEVSTKTVWNWTRDNSSYSDFKHPNMSNFLKVMNATSANPCHFFTTGE